MLTQFRENLILLHERSYSQNVDASGIITIAASVAGVIGVVLGAWQLRVQILDRRDTRSAHSADEQPYVPGAFPVAPPFGRLPRRVLGRDEMLNQLESAIAGRRGGVWVLAGMGGIGKSTVALQAAKFARSRGWQVWWVNAADAAVLTGGMLEVLDRLRAPQSVLRAVQEGVPTAIDRAWGVLAGHKAIGRCMLIFDNADAPEVLAAGGGLPSDGTGWLRSEGRLLQIVTTRHGDSASWGIGTHMCFFGPLDEASGAEVLRDLAARADKDSAGAVDLARRLGGLPLALHLAGTYLGSPFARWHSFTDYMSALATPEFVDAVADLDHSSADPRSAVAHTWELSVNALETRGIAQAKAMLQLLACFAPATRIPTGWLRADPLSAVIALSQPEQLGDGTEDSARLGRLIVAGLRGLATVGLIDISESDKLAAGPVLVVHPVISDINRASILTGEHSTLTVVGSAAINIVDSAAQVLDPWSPADWPNWRMLTPHLSALVQWLAKELDAEEIGRLADLCASTCVALVECGAWSDAESLAQTTLFAAEQLSGDNHVALHARRILATVSVQHGRHSEAEAMYQSLLAEQQRILGKEHPDTLLTSQQMAWVMGEQGRFDEAEPILRETLDAQVKILGSDHLDTLNSQHNLAWVIAERGNPQQAEQLCRQILAARERTVGSEHPTTLATTALLAMAITQQGRIHEARQIAQDLYEKRNLILGADHPNALETAHMLALLLIKQNRRNEAKKLLRATLAGREATIGPDHVKTIATRTDLASIMKPSLASRRRRLHG